MNMFQNNRILSVLVILILCSAIFAQNNSSVIELNFPENWTLGQTSSNISATSPSKKAQIFVTNTQYSDDQQVYDKILVSYFQKNFTNLNKIASETAEGDGIYRSMITYRGIAKSDKKPVYVVTQFASMTDEPDSKIILYTGIIRQSEGRQVLETVYEAFRNIAIPDGSNDEIVEAPVKPNLPKPTPTPSQTTTATGSTTNLNCPGSKLTESEIRIILKQHNDERAKVGVAPLTWNCTLANYAQKWANQGIFEHSTDKMLQNIIKGVWAGENLAADSDPNAVPGVQGWIDEKPFWNNRTATCKAGEVCGHYTQMVWRTTTQIGCGINRNAPGEFRQMFVCNYSPGGNDGGPAF